MQPEEVAPKDDPEVQRGEASASHSIKFPQEEDQDSGSADNLSTRAHKLAEVVGADVNQVLSHQECVKRRSVTGPIVLSQVFWLVVGFMPVCHPGILQCCFVFQAVRYSQGASLPGMSFIRVDFQRREFCCHKW